MAVDPPTARDVAVSSREHTFSPRELALIVGVSESSMKRWIDAGDVAAARTAGGHRRVSRREAIRFIRERGLPVADLSALRLPDFAGTPTADGAAAPTPKAIIQALQDGDPRRARALVLAEYVRGTSVAVLCDGLVRQTLHRAGKLWKESDAAAGISVEHEATDMFIQALGQIRSLRPLPSSDAPVAVGGAISGDPYIIPSLMAATVLEDLGFDVTNLGPDTPIDVLAETAQRRRADLVWLSISTVSSLDALRRAGAALETHLKAPDVRVIVGGRGATEEDLPGVTVLPSMQALVAIGEQIRSARRGEA